MTAFTAFPFAATIGSATRTDPARWSDIKNVKDFGATGDGSTDDRAAIQAAIDYTTAPFSTANRGVIFFPPGTYHIAASGGVGLTFNQGGNSSIVFMGCGDCSVISGSFAGPLLQRDLAGAGSPYSGTKVIEKLSFVNGHATGVCVQWGSSVGLSVRQCLFSGYQCLMLADTVSFSSDQSFMVDACVFTSNGLVGATAINIAGNGTVQNCDITGFALGLNMYGVGANVIGCRFETNTVAIRLAEHIDGSTGSSMVGFLIAGSSFESNGTAILFPAGAGYGLIAGLYIIGFPGATIYEGTVVASTTITGATSGAIGTGSIASDGTLTMTAIASGTFQSDEFISGTNVPSGTFIKSIPGGGHTGSYGVRGSPAYGIRMPDDECTGVVFSGVTCGPACTVASIYTGDTTNRGATVYNGVSATNGLSSSLFPSATAWRVPTTAHTAEFINCTVNPTYLFAGLPTGANLRTSDTYYITNGNQATPGQAVTGAGSNKSWVTWDGSNWIRGAA